MYAIGECTNIGPVTGSQSRIWFLSTNRGFGNCHCIFFVLCVGGLCSHKFPGGRPVRCVHQTLPSIGGQGRRATTTAVNHSDQEKTTRSTIRMGRVYKTSSAPLDLVQISRTPALADLTAIHFGSSRPTYEKGHD